MYFHYYNTVCNYKIHDVWDNCVKTEKDKAVLQLQNRNLSAVVCHNPDNFHQWISIEIQILMKMTSLKLWFTPHSGIIFEN